MKSLILLVLAMMVSCAEDPALDLIKARTIFNAQEASSINNVKLITNEPKASSKQTEEDLRPYIAPLPYFCDPNFYPSNIVLTAAACRPFLNGFIRQGYLVDRLGPRYR